MADHEFTRPWTYMWTRPDEPIISIPPTEYAITYTSRWTNVSDGFLTDHELELLSHVNCSYLSRDMPPTLLALKQHAQSLAILIRKLCFSTKFGVPDAENNPNYDPDDPDALRFRENEAFDWLNNLNEPYENDDEFHSMPLHALKNDLRYETEDKEIKVYCPLINEQESGPLSFDGKPTQRSPTTHQALVRHANECLEMLDHELSATGGLMSLLPTDEEEDVKEMAAARNTLLGQWLLHQQQTVVRMHELEVNYANALDALEGDAVVPRQLLSQNSLDIDPQVAYPQDKYVLVNAGQDVHAQIHDHLDDREADMQDTEEMHRARGLSGDRMWSDDPQDGEDGVSRGLVGVDLVSRCYRVKGIGRDSPLFLLPASENHRGVIRTREMEKKPKVVSVVAPRWPSRVTDWENSFKDRLNRASEVQIENAKLQETLDAEGTRESLLKERDELYQKIEHQKGRIHKIMKELLHRSAEVRKEKEGQMRS